MELKLPKTTRAERQSAETNVAKCIGLFTDAEYLPTVIAAGMRLGLAGGDHRDVANIIK